MTSFRRLDLAGVVVAATLSFLAGCAETPKAPASEPPAAATSVAPPAAPPAVPPTDGHATAIENAAGSVAPVRAQPSAREVATTMALTPVNGVRYECVQGPPGAEMRNGISFPEGSGRVCSRFPAMGPCQYERAACRARGGRVIRFDGVEITPEIEKEYDKQVQRFRFNAG